jgi:GTP-binding protein
MSTLPIVALVGRPNVGKSTFFNRLIGRPQAIVVDEPGTTRDRNYGQTTWNDRTFLVVDTGGLDFVSAGAMPRAIREQAQMAIDEADVIVFMVDARTGLAPSDYEVAEMLRAQGRPVILAANKAESEVRRLDSAEFFALGLGEPIPISGQHGLNTGDLLDAITAALPDGREEDEEEEDVPRITFVGRPNVGKSSLLNAILQQDRALVSPVPGTTRDSTDTELMHEGRRLILVDTAGIRKRGHVDRGVEQFSVLRAMRAITRSEVAVLVIDATEPSAAQDAHIAGYAWDAAKGLVVVVNKWDLVVPKDEHTIDQYTRRLRHELRFVHDVPIVFTSALTRQRVRKILDLALQVRDERLKRVPTGQLNATIQEALRRHQPASHGGKLLKLRYVTQTQVDPPTFVFFVNDPKLVHFSYRRFLENQLRQQCGFTGTAIRMYFRSSREAPAGAHHVVASIKGARGSTTEAPAASRDAAPRHVSQNGDEPRRADGTMTDDAASTQNMVAPGAPLGRTHATRKRAHHASKVGKAVSHASRARSARTAHRRPARS